MILKRLKRLFARKKKKKEGIQITEELEREIKGDLEPRIEELLRLASDNGLTYIQRKHVQHILVKPSNLCEEDRKQIVLLLQQVDFKMRLIWEEQIGAYIRVPVQELFTDTRTSSFPWGRAPSNM